QAEDGIRDFHVTGVPTCALPIYQQLPPPVAHQILERGAGDLLLLLQLLERRRVFEFGAQIKPDTTERTGDQERDAPAPGLHLGEIGSATWRERGEIDVWKTQ